MAGCADFRVCIDARVVTLIEPSRKPAYVSRRDTSEHVPVLACSWSWSPATAASDLPVRLSANGWVRDQPHTARDPITACSPGPCWHHEARREMSAGARL
jgi:hypothetical protein